MRKALFVFAFVIPCVLYAAVTLSAHHTWPVNNERLVTVRGVVLDFAWGNPHPMITLEVKNEAGQIDKWSIGGPAINRMQANGWTPTTVKAGDVITGTGYQFRDGQKTIRLERVVLADGREMRVYAR